MVEKFYFAAVEVDPAAQRELPGDGSPMEEGARTRWLTPTAFGGAAGMLAASLVLGLFIGLSNLSQGMLPALEDMTGITLGSGSHVVAQVDLLDEDLL